MSGYNYDEMSGKVVQGDRRLLDAGAGSQAVNTNPQSMAGRVSVKEMGSGLVREKAQREEVEKEIASYEEKRVRRKRRKQPHKRSVVGSAGEAGAYIPTTESSRAVFSSVMAWCAAQLDNDMPDSVVRSLADVVVETVKGGGAEKEIRRRLEETVEHPIEEEQMVRILDLCRRIIDYGEGGDVEGSEEDSGSESEASGSESDDSDESHDTQSVSDSDSDGPTVVQLGATSHFSALNIRDVSPIWLAKQVAEQFPKADSYRRTEIVNEITEGLGRDLRKFQKSLRELVDYDNNNEWAQQLLANHERVLWGLRVAEAKDKEAVLAEMPAELALEWRGKHKRDEKDSEEGVKRQQGKSVPKYIDLSSLVFDEGSRLMTSTKFTLPKGSFKRAKPSWEEVHIPPPESAPPDQNERLVEVSELPDWAQEAFPSAETATLNRIQSKVYPEAFLGDSNLLMCAPTGAGKTNVAMLAVLRVLGQYREQPGWLKRFKVVYIAPLKALVQEQVREFQRRLQYLGVSVSELTGDSNLTQHQIASTQILVTTPEKWDVITRKNNDASYAKLVRLVIIDEIHLLHDERGPVIESIVARSLRQEDSPRLVGLSATLPNYADVAEFLRVPENGLFYFDASFRPCPLAQQFVGITEKKALKRYQAMNDACAEKVAQAVAQQQQVIVFVHSRKETAKTALYLAEKLAQPPFSDGVREILRSEAENAANKSLKQLLPSGLGIHHAGMNRHDRSTVEDLFAQGYLKVLVSTATLAWGVNLPAHTVIIKGTSIYSPQEGAWVQLSPQDILQMLGRAGRPRYDTHGEGIIITSQEDVKYYLAILNQQLAIESQMAARLPDALNAEIVAGNIRTPAEAVDWFTYTYLYVRMMHARRLYRIGPEYDDDEMLIRRCGDLVHSALTVLAKNGLVKYKIGATVDPSIDASIASIVSTHLGTVASYYYISYESMHQYDRQLRPYMGEVELFEVFAGSGEFQYLQVREEEKEELKKLVSNAPIPISVPSDDPLAKANVLLQAYISRLRLDGFALMADMLFVVQNAGRLFRAMYEIVLRRKWARLAHVLLQICKMVDNRIWLTSSPLRQFADAPKEIIRASDRSLTPWKQFLALRDEETAVQALKAERFGNLAWELLQKFPQIVSIQSTLEPITASLLRVQLEIVPKWKWDVSVHGYSQTFSVFVEDCDGERLLYTTKLSVSKSHVGQSHWLDFAISLPSGQPNLFVSVSSDSWLNCERREAILLDKVVMPKRFPAPTPLLEGLPLVSVDEVPFSTSLFSFSSFNQIQSQVFDSVYAEDDNVLCCCPKGSGKTVVAELALLNHWRHERGRAVYLDPVQENIDALFKQWKKGFAKVAGGKTVAKLSGELSTDLKLLASSHLVLGTPAQFDLLSRRWQHRKNVQSVELVIADDCHRLDSVYENVLSRLRFMDANTDSSVRLVALSSPIASYNSFADWLGVKKKDRYSFGARMQNVAVQFAKIDISHNPSALQCMVRPACEFVGDESAVVFVAGRRQCVDTAREFLRRLTAQEKSWLRVDEESLQPHLKKVRDQGLRVCLEHGIGYLYNGMAHRDSGTVERLFKAGALGCLVASKETCYFCPEADRVVVMGTSEYDGKEHRYVDYTLDELLEMVGLAQTKALVLTNSNRLEYYKKFVAESLPIESQIKDTLADLFVCDISSGLIKNRQHAVDWVTYTYFYQRLQMNPSFYGLSEVSENGLAEYLSELVENVLKELQEGKLIELDIDDDEEEDEDLENKEEVTPLNGCMIAAYYNVSFATLRMFLDSFTPKTRLRKLLEVVSCAAEFDSLPMRLHESDTLFRLYNGVPVKWTGDVDFENPSLKAFILLQSHFSRVDLPADLQSDLNFVLSKVLSLLYAAVDVLSGEGWLNALSVMDLCQMVVQGMWNSDNVLKQVPSFDSKEVLDKCKSIKVETVYDIMALEDDERDSLLAGLGKSQVAKVAEFVNKYPNLEVSYELDTARKIVAGEPSSITVKIERDDEPEDLAVVSARYPHKKQESWWLVVGDQATKQLYAIKKLVLAKQTQEVRLNFTVPDSGKRDLTVWCICDSYFDADKQIEMKGVDVE